MSQGLTARIWTGLTRNVAFTAPGAEDERLRGRTYAIPFQTVWQASVDLVNGGLKRWELTEQDDEEGVIRGVAHSMAPGFDSAVTVRITLDPNAQTRVDALSASQVARADLGSNVRRLRQFFRALDKALGGPPDQASAGSHSGESGSEQPGTEQPDSEGGGIEARDVDPPGLRNPVAGSRGADRQG